jgi:hypothetical protein
MRPYSGVPFGHVRFSGYDPIYANLVFPCRDELEIVRDEIGQPIDELADRRGRRPKRPTE